MRDTVQFDYEDHYGFFWTIVADVEMGAPEIAPGYDHGGIPADGPTIERIRVLGAPGSRWRDVDDLSFQRAELDEIEKKVMEEASDG